MNWWLPNCALKSTHLETNVHVEWFAKDIFALSHYGHPFGKDRNPSMPILESFTNFYNLITNRDKVHQPSTCPPVSKLDNCTHELLPSLHPKKVISESQRLQIALSMRHDYSIIKTVYRYQPTHKILNEICMLIQTKAFIVGNKSSNVAPLPLSDFCPNNPNHVIVREIAFGPLSSPSDRPLALWFNIPNDHVEECTPKEMLRLKRTERKLMDKKKIAAQKKVVVGGSLFSGRATYADITGPHSKSYCDVPISFEDTNPNIEKKFDIYAPTDKISYELSSDILKHRVNILTKDCGDNEDLKHLKKRFYAMKYHFSNLSWPINEGREIVDRTTPVPRVDTQYTVPETTAGVKGYEAKMCWKSFANTLSKFSKHDDSHSCSNRCGVFDTLSKGISISNCR